MNAICNFLHTVTANNFRKNWRHYTVHLEKHRSYFGQKIDSQIRNKIIRPDLVIHIIPAIFMIIFCCRGTIFLIVPNVAQTTYQQLNFFVGLFQPFLQRAIDLILIAWCYLQLAVYTIELYSPLVASEHLVILVIKPEGPIRPQDVGLEGKQYKKFNKLRMRTIRIIWWLNTSLCSIGTMVSIISGFIEDSFSINWIAIIIWIPIFIIFAFNICYGIYTLPFLFVLMAEYLRLKQSNLILKLNYLNTYGRNIMPLVKTLSDNRQRNHRTIIFTKFYRIYKKHIEWINEVECYNKHYWNRYLSYLFLVVGILITYITYLVFILNSPIYIKFIFNLIWLAHINNLTLVLYYSSVLVINHHKLRLQMIYFYRLGLMLNLFNHRDYLKISEFLNNELNHTSGFRLWNNYLLKPMTFVAVGQNLSTLFFLVLS